MTLFCRDLGVTPAEQILQVHDLITAGLGIVPQSKDWPHVESVMALHDTNTHIEINIEKLRFQFGDSVALYFSFLSAYTQALLFPSILGLSFYLFDNAYSPIYSSLLLLWSISFTQWWSIRERILSAQWGTRGSFNVEKRRKDYIPGFPWWKRDLRIVISIPVIIFFAAVLAGLLMVIFILEAFVTELYTGPGHQFIVCLPPFFFLPQLTGMQGFCPTILFTALVPRLLSIYHASAVLLTRWENHAHESSYEASLTRKTFALSAIVAYLGLALSAFVYIPFGGDVMRWVQMELFSEGNVFGGRNVFGNVLKGELWMTDLSSARQKLNPKRLQDQMFVYTVQAQVVNAFTEIVLPYILRWVDHVRINVLKKNKKRVIHQDQINSGDDGEEKENREFLERVRSQVELPPYELFEDYSEMVTQFGYIVCWSTIWPLAPGTPLLIPSHFPHPDQHLHEVVSFLNNILEGRSDEFKITHHHRRPIPIRTETIGPWLDSLCFLTWLGTLTNSALVYLFKNGGGRYKMEERLMMKVGLVVLLGSHGYFVVRGLVRHILERVVWEGSGMSAESGAREKYLRGVEDSVGGAEGVGKEFGWNSRVESHKTFWSYDEGLDEIKRIGKEA